MGALSVVGAELSGSAPVDVVQGQDVADVVPHALGGARGARAAGTRADEVVIAETREHREWEAPKCCRRVPASQTVR